MATSTNYQLALRAVEAAKLLDTCRNKLSSEMKNQHPDFDPAMSKPRGKTVTLPTEAVNEMIVGMAQMSRKIRSYDAPKGSN